MSASGTSAESLKKIETAVSSGKLTAGAGANLRQWLTEARYATYVPAIVEHIAEGQWQALDDAFWTVIPFGTGGRRGRMYPIGCNAINDRTIGESAQGLAQYVREQLGDQAELSCAIAYDTRHRSRHFAELCAGIMAAAGFKVYFLDDYRSTPELSFLVRYKNCSCGIMVTASHNPPSDNAVKVYWSNGAQVLPPHDQAIIDRVMSVQDIRVLAFDEALRDGRIILCKEEVDAAYLKAVEAQQLPGPRNLSVIYSPLHGVGASAVMPVLKSDGFETVELFEPHAEPNGDFPNVPGHVSNPENPKVFDSMIARAREIGADLVLATDPDCDRMGAGAPRTKDTSGEWGTFTGNQLGALLVDFILEQRRQAGTLTSDHYVVKTLVTTELVRRIAESYGVRCYGNLHVGFKWIADQVDRAGPEGFVFGTEESHGFMVGTYTRDKDGAVACMLLSELAAHAKAQGKTLHEKLDSLFWQHGYHGEHTLNFFMEGSEGMSRMQALMAKLREEPPTQLAGVPVQAVRDYKSRTVVDAEGRGQLDAPAADMLTLDLAATGNFVAIRPSGTEPKVKVYVFTFMPAELLHDLDEARRQMTERIEHISADFQTLIKSV